MRRVSVAKTGLVLGLDSYPAVSDSVWLLSQWLGTLGSVNVHGLYSVNISWSYSYITFVIFYLHWQEMVLTFSKVGGEATKSIFIVNWSFNCQCWYFALNVLNRQCLSHPQCLCYQSAGWGPNALPREELWVGKEKLFLCWQSSSHRVPSSRLDWWGFIDFYKLWMLRACCSKC